MECFTGIGAAVAAGAAAKTFKYNRENFQEDREQRRRAAVKVMSWRVEQAKLWRQDVRDLISLTEYKMQAYLITNVLVLGFTIFLWTEGRLPAGTPQWLMLGNVVSIGAAFMFLLLSIWLAMNAAVAAQSFEARLLTQMVRLPIPTWEECEATRTYGSEFEKLEGRQMFRVPWVMGWQENLVGKRPSRASQDDNGDSGDSDAGNPAMASGGSTIDPASTTTVSFDVQSNSAPDSSSGDDWNVDPWGLEQAGEGMPELGCGLGSDVARLRHVKLSRQAAIEWQTYDAFSRISLSMGVQQLMTAMSYYMLGYLLVQVGSKTAGLLGVIVFTMISYSILSFDLTLKNYQMRIAQAMLILGPLAAAFASIYWAAFENQTTEYIAPIAFLAHGSYVAWICYLAKPTVTENGAWMPKIFRSVLYLDVFSWTRGQASGKSPKRHAPSGPETSAEEGKPAIQGVRYENGIPVPMRPDDMTPQGVRQDLMGTPGAPIITRPAISMEGRDEEFYNPASFLPVDEDDVDGEAGEQGNKKAWIEKVGPGELPYRVFCGAMMLVALTWFIACVYCIHGAKTDWSLDLSIKEIRHRAPKHRPGFLGPKVQSIDHGHQWWDDLTYGNNEAEWQRWSKQDTVAPMSLLAEKPLSLFSGDAGYSTSNSMKPEQIKLSWPSPNIAPTHLSCDAGGSHFLMADRVLMYSATMGSQNTVTNAAKSSDAHVPRAVFGELDCPALLGEGLEDVALSCNSTAAGKCEVLALHRHGRRIAACPLRSDSTDVALVGTDADITSKVEEISDKWLERPRSHPNEHAARARTEKALSISMSPECKGEIGAEFCTVLGTTHGRVVQLGRHSSRKELIPTEILYENSGDVRPAPISGVVRAFNNRYLGVLQPDKGSIGLLDLSKGGLPTGSMPLHISKPAASFCAGGGHAYILTRGPDPEMWRIPLPAKLRSDVLRTSVAEP